MLKLVKRPKSPYWVLRGTVGGRRIEETTGTASRTEAESLRIAREREFLDRRLHGDAAALTFGAAALTYLEAKKRATRQEAAVLALVDYFGERRAAASIDKTAIAGAVLKLAGPNASPAKINRWAKGPLSAVLKHSGIAAKVSREREPEARVRWITQDEARRLLDGCILWQKHMKPLVTFLLFTGARCGEALALQWGDVDLQARSVTFRAETTKAKRSRTVPLPGPAFEALANLRHRTGHVFRNREGHAYTRSSSGNPIANPFASICRRAGIDNFTPHDLRHTWATWHYRANRDLLALQQLGGWKSLDMVQKYAHVDAETHRVTADRLGESWGSVGSMADKTHFKSIN
jgi:integrase